MTRREQLAAKKNAKNQEADDGNGEKDAEADHGDDENETSVMKKPAARGRAKSKSKAEEKKEAKTEKATHEEPKAKSAPKKKSKKKAKKQQDESEHEEPGVPETEQDSGSARRKLFEDADQEAEGAPEETVAAHPPPTRRRKRKCADAADPSGQSTVSPKAKAKAKAAPRRPKRANGEDQNDDDGQKAQPKRRAKKSRKQREAEEAALVDSMDMEDEVMKGVVLQVLREVKTMTVDELKEHLSSKKDTLPGKNATLNVYWSRTNSRCKYLLDPATPDTANFYFTSGTWNTKMAAAFICSWLMVTQHCSFFQQIK